MIDNLALGLTHALMLIAAWRLLKRADLDREDGGGPVGMLRKRGTFKKEGRDA